MKRPIKAGVGKLCLYSVSLVTLILAFQPLPPAAATPIPIITNRYVDPAGSDGGLVINTCTNPSNPCLTVAHAIAESGANDVIHIAAGTYSPVKVSVAKSLTFLGAGMHSTILDANGTGSVFTISSAVTVTIEDLTIQHGNSGIGTFGGGIYQPFGNLTLIRVELLGNTGDLGGGIYSNGSLSMTDSLVYGNGANLQPSGDGGGLYLNGDGQTYTLTNVTIRDNLANDDGGGIHDQASFSPSGSLTMTNVTISGNMAKVGAAGEFTNNSYTVIINSTIAGNHFLQMSGAYNGGINDQAQMAVYNSIIANNEGSNCVIGTISTYLDSYGNNIDSGSTCQFNNPSIGDHQNTDPKLSGLVDHGGPTPTMALLHGSPAIDGVTFNAPNSCPATDQRGVARPVGVRCDIGAFEGEIYPVFLPMVIR